jgi:PAS domain S-box-containing protein
MPVDIQPTPLVVPYVLSAILTLALTAYGLRELRSGGWDNTTASFVGIVLGSSIWSVSRAVEFVFVSETITRLAIGTLYIGYGGATMSVLFFALAFTGRKDILQRRYVALILTFPFVAVLLAYTNVYHELLWVGEFTPYQDVFREITVFRREFQPLFHVYLAYSVGGTIIGIYLLLRMAVESPDVYRQQTILFSIGAGTALTLGVLYALEAQPVVPAFIDLTPVGFGVTGLCFGYAIFKYQMLDLVPVARDTVIESMRDGYIVLDTDERIVDLNNAAVEVLDTDDQVVGKEITESLPEARAIIDDHEHGTRSESEFNLEIDGEQRFLVANVSSLYENEKLIGRLLLLRDVTERRAVQKRYQALIENSSDLILVVEEDATITYASPSIRNITGVEPEDVEGRNSLTFIHDDDRDEFEEMVDEILENPGERRRQEYRTYTADGDWIYLEASVWNLLDNPFVEGIVVNAREITERKKREEEIRQKNQQLEQANEQLEQFASVISHDLRNPINVARGHLELAEETGREESFEKIGDSLQRMEAIIDDVLTLAREGESIGETQEVSLEERAELAWDHVATDEAKLVVTDDTTFQADPDRLLQLFENLFRNAHEHVGDDVQVTVGFDNGALYVEDDGPGIPEDRRDKVLESGHTTNEEGTGLGLSIVSQIAEAHGWDVQVADGSNGGARFEFPGVDSDVVS